MDVIAITIRNKTPKDVPFQEWEPIKGKDPYTKQRKKKFRSSRYMPSHNCRKMS
jgi:hypothetical protein